MDVVRAAELDPVARGLDAHGHVARDERRSVEVGVELMVVPRTLDVARPRSM